MKFYIFAVIIIWNCQVRGQVTNYVSNGSFESLNSNSVSTLYNVVNYWQPIDTGQACDYLATLLPPFANAPGAFGYQFPRTGNNYIISQFWNFRGYPRNRLKQKLKANTAYCVKYHVVNTNNNPYAVDGFGAYFANKDLDTITQCNVALSYLTPQVKNPNGNIITDTLNWISITGTFVADGTEKYMVIGNFKTDAATSTLLINPTYSTTITADICIDDVSCIELNLPAFAGRDTVVFSGDSVFLGREPDVGIDETCIWYKLPGIQPMDTIAGFWIKSTTTSTYVVRQEICGLVKWDTVRIYMNAVGENKLKLINEELKIFPIPADKTLELKINNEELFSDYKRLAIFNNLGERIREEELTFENNHCLINTSELPKGVYSLQIINGKSESVSKRFVVSR